MKRTMITEVFGWKGFYSAPALELTLVDGQRVYLSLNVPGGEDLLERLNRMTRLEVRSDVRKPP